MRATRLSTHTHKHTHTYRDRTHGEAHTGHGSAHQRGRLPPCSPSDSHTLHATATAPLSLSHRASQHAALLSCAPRPLRGPSAAPPRSPPSPSPTPTPPHAGCTRPKATPCRPHAVPPARHAAHTPCRPHADTSSRSAHLPRPYFGPTPPPGAFGEMTIASIFAATAPSPPPPPPPVNLPKPLLRERFFSRRSRSK